MIFQKSKWNMLPLFNSVSASTWKQNAIKVFQNLFWLSSRLSQCYPSGRADCPVNVSVLCLGISFIAFKGHVCMLPLLNEVSIVLPLKDVYSPALDKVPPPGLSPLALSAACVPSLMLVGSQLLQKNSSGLWSLLLGLGLGERPIFFCPTSRRQSQARGNHWKLPHTPWDIALRSSSPCLRCLTKEPCDLS